MVGRIVKARCLSTSLNRFRDIDDGRAHLYHHGTMEHEDVSGALEKVKIMVGRQGDGCTYSLHPASRRLILQRFHGVHPAPTVFVGYETRDDFERYHGPMWGQIALILTGLSETQLRGLGGFLIYDPMSETVVYDSAKAA